MSEDKIPRCLIFCGRGGKQPMAAWAASRSAWKRSRSRSPTSQGYRKQVEAELEVVRARQDQQDVFNRGISTFFAELQSTLSRIERKLDGGE